MLEISRIVKNYQLKDQVVPALKGVDIVFRRSEFVAVLGPSGCGKTTLLNIIGGLDRYTSGDLIIEGVSTKHFKDKDWDNYRNHRVGFVFQSYNLIPHQSVVENVELALTLSGVKKKERRKRAIEVLEKVGLGDRIKAKPNQLSGGQMQRVAIARALVNDPEIILADEPTGALDSKTSVQIMELLKEVSKDRLVIMVTHNPDLANKYANRIVRMLDGEVIEDTKPYTKEKADREIEKHKAKVEKLEDNGFKKTKKKKSMSLFTAMFLSFKNLLTKKGRTIMVAFAGSIGIIGIALVLAVSAGMTNYINAMQSESLSSYPVAVSSIAIDMNAALEVLGGGNKVDSHEGELTVYDPSNIIMGMGQFNYLGKYELEDGTTTSFVDYIDNYYKNENKKNLLNDYKVSYASTMHIITQYGAGYMPINNDVQYSVMSGTTSSLFFEELDNKNYVLSLYDVIEGEYPTSANEVALVVGENGSLSTIEMMMLGFEPKLIKQDGEEDKYEGLKYTDALNKTYKLIYHDAYYQESGVPNLDFSNITSLSMPDILKLADMYNSQDSEELKISCILRQKKGATGSLFSNGIMYTKSLSEKYRENCKNSKIVEYVKSTFLNGENFKEENLTKDFTTDGLNILPYAVNISELTSYSSEMGTKMFKYTTLQDMIDALKKYKIELSPNDLVDLYLQMYGASSVPTGVYFYAKSFEAKDDIMSMIGEWNNLSYAHDILASDSSAMLTSMLGTLVNIVSYVLIAFAAISLVVSSIMIGIITYTSVIERTKEIGVLRSIGASKHDVSNVFNAETLIIGLFAGLLGVGVSLLLTIPISLLLKNLTGIGGLAVLNPLPAVVLVAISMFLTFIAGLIPARIASKKDPVIALRTE